MNILNETGVEKLEANIQLTRKAIVSANDDETMALLQSNLQRYEDELIIHKALLSINMEHCDNVGVNFIELFSAIKRSTIS